MSVLIGYQLAAMITFILTAMATVVFKAVAFSKVAVVVSLILLAYKQFGGKYEPKVYYKEIPSYVDIEDGQELNFQPGSVLLFTLICC